MASRLFEGIQHSKNYALFRPGYCLLPMLAPWPLTETHSGHVQLSLPRDLGHRS